MANKTYKKSQARIFIIIIFMAIIVISLSYLAITSFAVKDNEETIKVGAILPLTGQMSFTGEEVKNSISLAATDINSLNDKKIEIIYEDSKMDSKEGVSAINKLIEVDKVEYVYVFGTPIINAVQPITENKSIILAGASISPKILENKDYTLRLNYNLNQALDKMNIFIDEKKFSHIAVLYQGGEAWESQVTQLENRGINFIAKEKFALGEKDFRTQLLKIKKSNPDLLIILGYGSQFPSLFSQIEELGMKNIPVLGGLDFFEVPKESVSLYENVVFVVPSFSVEPNKQAENFIAKYKNNFSSTPTHQGAYAYDTINLLYLCAIKNNKNPKSAISYIKNFGSYIGVTGKIDILPNGDSKSSLLLATYKNGKIEPYRIN